jgi:PKHD-type hydroxylase
MQDIMAFQSVWYETKLNSELVDIIEREAKTLDLNLSPGITGDGELNPIRNSEVSWLPDTHWISGLCYHFVMKANKDNFKYDITGFDNGQMQYTSYSEGEFYNWHTDTSISTTSDNQLIRKLSFILQLSNYDEYTGGEVQIINDDGDCYFLPKTKGTILIFDSRARHRVRKVHSGNRKSLVGWVVGPRWK